MFVGAISTFAAAYVFTYLTSSWFIRLAWKRQLLDVPNGRSTHTLATPRGAGITFVTALALAWLIATLVGIGDVDRASWLAWTLIVPVAVVGFLDDVFSVPVVLRLFVHMGTAVCVVWLVAAPKSVQDALVSLPAIVLVVWTTNLFNFMDGADGLAATQALSSIGGLSWLAWTFGTVPEFAVVLLLATCVGSLLGFLHHNWPPARVFMGDVGSTSLGFLVGLSTVLSSLSATTTLGQTFLLVAMCVTFAPFLIDATMTLLMRVARGEPWWTPHRMHLFQRLIDDGASARVVAVSYSALAIVGSGVAATVHSAWGTSASVFIAVAWMLGLAAAFTYASPRIRPSSLEGARAESAGTPSISARPSAGATEDRVRLRRFD